VTCGAGECRPVALADGVDMHRVQSSAQPMAFHVDDYTAGCFAEGSAADNLTVLIFQLRLGLNGRQGRLRTAENQT